MDDARDFMENYRSITDILSVVHIHPDINYNVYECVSNDDIKVISFESFENIINTANFIGNHKRTRQEYIDLYNRDGITGLYYDLPPFDPEAPSRNYPIEEHYDYDVFKPYIDSYVVVIKKLGG